MKTLSGHLSMEHHKDYMQPQSEMIARLLRKLLEKLLKMKSSNADINEMENVLTTQISANPMFSIERLSEIKETQLVETLINHHSYNPEDLKLLADLLYEFNMKFMKDRLLFSKILILYEYYQSRNKTAIDFVVFNRITDLKRILSWTQS